MSFYLLSVAGKSANKEKRIALFFNKIYSEKYEFFNNYDFRRMHVICSFPYTWFILRNQGHPQQGGIKTK